MVQWHLRLATLATLAAFGCKEEGAPKPNDSKKPTPAYTPAYTPSYQPSNSTNDDQTSASEDSSTGCSSSTCSSPGTLQIQANGVTVTTLTLNSQTPTATLTVKSATYTGRTFKLRVTSDQPSLQVTANDTESVSVSLNSAAGNSISQGTLSIKARDSMACDKNASGSDCGTMDTTSSNDQTLTLPWSTNGVVNTGGNAGTGGGSNTLTGTIGGDLALGAGLNILSGFLGIGGCQPVFFGNPQGFYGNQFSTQQWGNNGWNNQFGNQNGNYNYNYNTIGGGLGNSWQQGNFNNNNIWGNGNSAYYGNNGSLYGNSGSGIYSGSSSCYSRTYSTCSSGSGCYWDGTTCQGNGGGTYNSFNGSGSGYGTCSQSNCTGCRTQSSCTNAYCSWSSGSCY